MTRCRAMLMRACILPRPAPNLHPSLQPPRPPAPVPKKPPLSPPHEEYSSPAVATNANVIAVRILEKVGPEGTRVSFTQEDHMFHVLVSEGITFICMAQEVCGGLTPTV